MRVLLIEDLAEPAQDIIAALNDLGCDVSWITGVVDISTHKFFDEFDGIAGSANGAEQLDLRDFHIALLDFEIEGSYNGSELVHSLRKSGVVCVGISAKADLNGEIMAAGAHLSVPKHVIADQLRYRQLDLDEIFETYSTDTGIPDEELIRSLITSKQLRVPNAPSSVARSRKLGGPN